MTITPDEYAKLVESEKRTYVGDNPASSIPKIFSYWATRYLSPRLHRLFGTIEIEMFFALEIARIKRELGLDVVNVLSLGSGECSLEVDIAKRLNGMGIEFSITCTDLSPGMIRAGGNAVRNANFSQNFKLIECDVNNSFPPGKFDVVVANHCLHHFVELEYIFDCVRAAIGNGGFVISDMIGRNGHMRWPETLEIVEAFWRTLPTAKRFDCLNRIQRGQEFVNFNCADGTFEGIRSQDILPQLLALFEFDRFLGYGGVPDIFVDRMYGHNFNASCAEDLAFIDALEVVNSKLTQSGQVKPTMMFATARLRAPHCVFDPVHPISAVRLPA